MGMCNQLANGGVQLYSIKDFIGSARSSQPMICISNRGLNSDQMIEMDLDIDMKFPRSYRQHIKLRSNRESTFFSQTRSTEESNFLGAEGFGSKHIKDNFHTSRSVTIAKRRLFYCKNTQR